MRVELQSPYKPLEANLIFILYRAGSYDPANYDAWTSDMQTRTESDAPS